MDADVNDLNSGSPVGKSGLAGPAGMAQEGNPVFFEVKPQNHSRAVGTPPTSGSSRRASRPHLSRLPAPVAAVYQNTGWLLPPARTHQGRLSKDTNTNQPRKNSGFSSEPISMLADGTPTKLNKTGNGLVPNWPTCKNPKSARISLQNKRHELNFKCNISNQSRFASKCQYYNCLPP